MGKIWVQTSSGRLIHLPIVEDDFNTPDDPVKIPTSVLSITRHRSGTIQIVSPEHGTVTFDFDVAGRTGSCNECGRCCSHPAGSCSDPDCGYVLNADLDYHVCQYLTIFKNNKWGLKDNTECSLGTGLINTFKGCTMGPNGPSEMHPHMTNCGFSF